MPENQRVLLSVQTPAKQDTATWLAEVQEMQQRIVSARGYFPDSTTDIAADRMRDE